MGIIAICGSMRVESNTNKLVRMVAESAGWEYEAVDFTKLTIQPCTGCMMCMMNEGQCPIDDDMQVLYEKMISADAIIIGSPTYYLDIAGAVKCMIDRSMALNYRGIGPMGNEDMPWLGQRPLFGKPGVAVVTVAGNGHERTLETLRICMEDCYRMKLVAKLAEPVGMDDVDAMPEVLKRAEEAGKKLSEALTQ
ncbi:MAG: flavodoxin family protein [Deltaproteobacteria bacterium]|nr:flavodoxin family protein [Deltaproteobacteria bacterium]